MYDYIIIGAGPGGLNCALELSKFGNKVALVENLEDIGGCHRVRYTNNKIINSNRIVHTEHGPRIYLGAYLNFWDWVQRFNIKKENDFKEYKFDLLSKDVTSFMSMFKIHELLSFVIVYILYCILRIPYSTNYSVEKFVKTFKFTEKGKVNLNKICRLIDGGNIDKTLIGALIDGFDIGLMYKIYEPRQPMNTLLWDKVKNKLKDQNVDLYLNTKVEKIQKGKVYTSNKLLHTDKIIVTVPPVALSKIDGVAELIGYDKHYLKKLAIHQEYEPYVSSTIGFEKEQKKSVWGIAGKHPWGIVDIDMGKYFDNVSGSMFIASVTHPDKIDPKTNMTANQMNETMFLDRIVELIKEKYKIKEEPIIKTLSPSVKKINGQWKEIDRSYMFSPPGFMKPSIELQNQNKVWITGHHLGNSYHAYNSMESALQNSNTLLSNIEPKINIRNKEPFRLSTLILVVFLVIIIYKSL